MKTKLQNLGIRFLVCGLMVMSSLYLVWPDPIAPTAAVQTAAPAALASALPSAASVVMQNQPQASPAVVTTRVSTVSDQPQKTRKILN